MELERMKKGSQEGAKKLKIKKKKKKMDGGLRV